MISFVHHISTLVLIQLRGNCFWKHILSFMKPVLSDLKLYWNPCMEQETPIHQILRHSSRIPCNVHVPSSR